MSSVCSTNWYKLLGIMGGGTPSYSSWDEVRISLPNRFMVVGGSGSGKTNFLMNLISRVNAWSRFYLFVKNPEEELYAALIAIIREAEEIAGVPILIVVSSTLEDLPLVDEFDPKYQSLVVFDDMLLSNPKEFEKMAEIFVRGRRRGISPVFVTQSFFGTPILIRQNTNVTILKLLKERDLKLVLSEFASDYTVKELQAMYVKSKARNVENWFCIDASPGQSDEFRYRANWEPIG